MLYIIYYILYIIYYILYIIYYILYICTCTCTDTCTSTSTCTCIYIYTCDTLKIRYIVIFMCSYILQVICSLFGDAWRSWNNWRQCCDVAKHRCTRSSKAGQCSLFVFARQAQWRIDLNCECQMFGTTCRLPFVNHGYKACLLSWIKFKVLPFVRAQSGLRSWHYQRCRS